MRASSRLCYSLSLSLPPKNMTLELQGEVNQHCVIQHSENTLKITNDSLFLPCIHYPSYPDHWRIGGLVINKFLYVLFHISHLVDMSSILKRIFSSLCVWLNYISWKVRKATRDFKLVISRKGKLMDTKLKLQLQNRTEM